MMLSTITQPPMEAVKVPPGLARDILDRTGVAVVFHRPDGAPADEAARRADEACGEAESWRQRLVRDVSAADRDSLETTPGVLRAAWPVRLRHRTVFVATAELTGLGDDPSDLGPRLLAAVADAVRARMVASTAQAERDSACVSLSNSFEEISLLHNLGEVLRIDRPVTELLEYVCGELRETVGAEAVVAWLPHLDGIEARTIVTGQLPFPADHLTRIVGRLLDETGPEHDVLISNYCQDDPALAGLSPAVRRVILVPLPLWDGARGALAAFNREDSEFGSPDAKLVRSATSASGIFIENRRLFRELHELMLDLVKTLVSSVEAKDPYTCGHSERVAAVSRDVARRLGLSDEQIEHVYLGGLLHDIGKIGTPESILHKNGKLDPEERAIINRHPETGGRILAGIGRFDAIREIVMGHHERLDGSGYPAGLRGEAVPLLARIVGLADAFDAMTSNRPYRSRLPLVSVKAEIVKYTGTQFDPRVAETFLAMDLEALVQQMDQHTAARNPAADRAVEVSHADHR